VRSTILLNKKKIYSGCIYYRLNLGPVFWGLKKQKRERGLLFREGRTEASSSLSKLSLTATPLFTYQLYHACSRNLNLARAFFLKSLMQLEMI
jgi:hypothetical protein